MAEYIEREALQKAVAGIHFDAVFARDFGKTFFHKVLNQYRDAVLDAIKKAPAADVVEVVSVEEAAALCRAKRGEMGLAKAATVFETAVRKALEFGEKGGSDGN